MSEISKEYFSNGHLTPLALLMLEVGGLSDDERELILTHILACDECMETYTESLTDDALVEPPQGLESKILKEVDETASKKQESKVLAIQFTKLGIAVCLTMVLMFGGAFDFIKNMDFTEKHPPIPNNTIRVEARLGETISYKFNKGFNEFASSINSGSFITDMLKQKKDESNKSSKNKNL